MVEQIKPMIMKMQNETLPSIKANLEANNAPDVLTDWIYKPQRNLGLFFHINISFKDLIIFFGNKKVHFKTNEIDAASQFMMLLIARDGFK